MNPVSFNAGQSPRFGGVFPILVKDEYGKTLRPGENVDGLEVGSFLVRLLERAVIAKNERLGQDAFFRNPKVIRDDSGRHYLVVDDRHYGDHASKLAAFEGNKSKFFGLKQISNLVKKAMSPKDILEDVTPNSSVTLTYRGDSLDTVEIAKAVVNDDYYYYVNQSII